MSKSKVKFNYKDINADSADKLIDRAVKSVASMQKAVQLASVSVLMHCKKHSDYSKANVLVKALGTGVRHKALVEFFVKFGGLTEGKEGFEGWKGKEAIDIEGAKEQPWWELKPEPIFKGMMAEKVLLKFLKDAKEMEEALKDLSEGDKKKVNLSVSESVKKQMVAYLNKAA